MLYFPMYGVWSMVVGNDGQRPVNRIALADANLNCRNSSNAPGVDIPGMRFVWVERSVQVERAL